MKVQRDTKQRRLIYETVMKHYDHPNAEEIYTDVHLQDAKISKGTVYRNLKILSDNEDIFHIKVPGADRYDSTLKNHYHILCTECGIVIDAPIDYISPNDDLVEEKTDFKIQKHQTVFEGVCPKCQNASKKQI